jgi:hypothetical protein
MYPKNTQEEDMTGHNCDGKGCKYVTKTEDDHIVNDDGGIFCLSCFEKRNLIVIKEIARMALQDAELFDEVGVELDLSDSELITIRDFLQIEMEK